MRIFRIPPHLYIFEQVHRWENISVWKLWFHDFIISPLFGRTFEMRDTLKKGRKRGRERDFFFEMKQFNVQVAEDSSFVECRCVSLLSNWVIGKYFDFSSVRKTFGITIVLESSIMFLFCTKKNRYKKTFFCWFRKQKISETDLFNGWFLTDSQ